MTLRKVMRKTMSAWMKGSGPHADIVLTSRVRLARNLDGFKFPHLASEDELKQVINSTDEVLKSQDEMGKFNMIRMQDLSPVERTLLVEKHLISPQLAESRHGAVALRENEDVAVMLNEEDHIRSQCLLAGLQLEKALEIENKIDDLLESSMDYAFSPEYGYLTTCPTNAGTGLRASIMVHLPGLKLTEKIRQLFSAVSKLGLAVRGLYGEGTDAVGNIYQISNQVTLGQSEEEIVENLKGVAYQVIEQESSARRALLDSRNMKIQDRVWRAYGILKNARVISSEEAMELLSEVRLGIDLDIIEGLKGKLLNELMVFIRPAYLQWIEREELSAFDRDIKRADLIRERLAQGE